MKRIHVTVLLIVLALSYTTDGLLAKKKEYYIVEVRNTKAYRIPEFKDTAGPRGAMFVDDIIGISWDAIKRKIKFQLNNRTQSPVTVVWKDCRFWDSDGRKYRVIHKKVRTIPREGFDTITSTLVKPGKRLYDFIYPINEEKNPPRSRVSLDPLYFHHRDRPIRELIKKNRIDEVREMINNQKFKVEMVLEAEGQRYRYLFEFASQLTKGDKKLYYFASR